MTGNIIVGVIILLALIYLVKTIIKAVKNKNSPCFGCKNKDCKDKNNHL
jgi:hypothetical protein